MRTEDTRQVLACEVPAGTRYILSRVWRADRARIDFHPAIEQSVIGLGIRYRQEIGDAGADRCGIVNQTEERKAGAASPRKTTTQQHPVSVLLAQTGP